MEINKPLTKEFIPYYIKIKEKYENLLNVIEIDTPDGKIILDRRKIKAKLYEEYENAVSSEDNEKISKIQKQMYDFALVEPKELNSINLLNKDVITYQRAMQGLNLLLNPLGFEDF